MILEGSQTNAIPKFALSDEARFGRLYLSLERAAAKGPHQNDLIMAVNIDRLARQFGALENQKRPRRSPASAATAGMQASNDPHRSASADHR